MSHITSRRTCSVARHVDRFHRRIANQGSAPSTALWVEEVDQADAHADAGQQPAAIWHDDDLRYTACCRLNGTAARQIPSS
jgi:hypothetical protein